MALRQDIERIIQSGAPYWHLEVIKGSNKAKIIVKFQKDSTIEAVTGQLLQWGWKTATEIKMVEGIIMVEDGRVEPIQHQLVQIEEGVKLSRRRKLTQDQYEVLIKLYGQGESGC